MSRQPFFSPVYSQARYIYGIDTVRVFVSSFGRTEMQRTEKLLGAGEKEASTVATVLARVVGPQWAALPYWC